MTEAQVIALLRKQVEAEGSRAAFAVSHDFSRSLLDMVLRGERKPPDAMLDILGLERTKETVIRYRRKPKAGA